MTQSLHSPIQWPVASIAGRPYLCKFSFASSLRVGRANMDARFPIVEVTPESDAAARQAASHVVVMRNLVLAACTLGTETPEGKWLPIAVDCMDDAALLDLQEQMLPNEFNTLVAAINEANRLAQEAQKAAQTAPLTTEPKSAIQ